MRKFVIYTAIFGSPGRFEIPEISIPDVDRFCFTDLRVQSGNYQAQLVSQNRDIKTSFYQVKRRKLDHLPAVMRQRFIKICIPDEIFNNYEYSVYVDCKRPVAVDFEYLLNCLEPSSDIVLRRHGRRSCIYSEGNFCAEKYRKLRRDILRQLDFYSIGKYPRNNGLYRTGLLFRRHTKEMKEFSKLWWEQIKKYSHRDQISFPYVVWKHNMKISLHKRMK